MIIANKVTMNSNNQPVILVVDDIPTNNILMKNLLRVRNYEVLLAQSGIEALRIAEERKPDVILLDIMMPVMDGYEVLARLRSNDTTKDIKVVMVSALGGKIDIENAMDLGADGYITTPVVVQKLYDLLDKFIN